MKIYRDYTQGKNVLVCELWDIFVRFVRGNLVQKPGSNNVTYTGPENRAPIKPI